MGVWDFIYSTTETVKRNAPDLSPVKNACKASYGYGSAAFWKIDGAVRVNVVQTLKNYMPDEQGRAQIALFASKLVQNAAYYGFKEAYNFVPVADAIKVNGAQKLKEYFPDPHLREKIGRILSNLGQFVVASAVNESLKRVTVKRTAPDLSPVKNACKASYGYGSSAFWKIDDDAVRVNGVQTLKNYMPDEQGRAQIALFAYKLVQNAAYYGFKEAYKFVPGGKTLAKIVSQTVSEVKSENLKKQVDKKKVKKG